jgi:hypothetical protein
VSRGAAVTAGVDILTVRPSGSCEMSLAPPETVDEYLAIADGRRVIYYGSQ